MLCPERSDGILSVLNDLTRTRAAVTVYLNRGRDFFITNLLEARGQHLVFDIGSNEDLNRKLESSPECLCIASHNGIRVRFTVAAPKRFQWGELDAYQAPLPASLLRLQRRETHRIVLSVTKPVPIRIERPANAKADTPAKAEHFPIHNLSVEAAGFNVSSEMLFRTGDALTIAFPLSRTASNKCSASERHVTHIGEANAKKAYLCLRHASAQVRLQMTVPSPGAVPTRKPYAWRGKNPHAFAGELMMFP